MAKGRKSEIVQVRVTPAQLRYWKKGAREAGLSLSEWIRDWTDSAARCDIEMGRDAIQGVEASY